MLFTLNTAAIMSWSLWMDGSGGGLTCGIGVKCRLIREENVQYIDCVFPTSGWNLAIAVVTSFLPRRRYP